MTLPVLFPCKFNCARDCIFTDCFFGTHGRSPTQGPASLDAAATINAAQKQLFLRTLPGTQWMPSTLILLTLDTYRQ
jgi:hypothetical protein